MGKLIKVGDMRLIAASGPKELGNAGQKAQLKLSLLSLVPPRFLSNSLRCRPMAPSNVAYDGMDTAQLTDWCLTAFKVLTSGFRF